MCDTTRQNGGSEETDAQVKILIYHLLMALRGVYKKTGIVDNPVISSQYVENASREYVENADLCLRIHATRSLHFVFVLWPSSIILPYCVLVTDIGS